MNGDSLYRRAIGVPPVVIHAYPKRRPSWHVETEPTSSRPVASRPESPASVMTASAVSAANELTYADFLGESMHGEVALAS